MQRLRPSGMMDAGSTTQDIAGGDRAMQGMTAAWMTGIDHTVTPTKRAMNGQKAIHNLFLKVGNGGEPAGRLAVRCGGLRKHQAEEISGSKVGVKFRRRQKSSMRAMVSGAVRGVVRRRIWRVWPAERDLASATRAMHFSGR